MATSVPQLITQSTSAAEMIRTVCGRVLSAAVSIFIPWETFTHSKFKNQRIECSDWKKIVYVIV